ncbi:MAG: hypothetical protein RMJ84_01585 [Sandaracinaceae bacterium]|nr:hypothetical protein [Sandaracinaceae bacterium]
MSSSAGFQSALLPPSRGWLFGLASILLFILVPERLEAQGPQSVKREGETKSPGEEASPQAIPLTPQATDSPFSLFLPPLLSYEESQKGKSLTIFPFFYLRESHRSKEFLIPPFYHREGDDPVDALFPLFFWLRGQKHHTLIFPLFFHLENSEGHDWGIPPLFWSGRRKGGAFYDLAPPFFFSWGDREQSHWIAGPAYRFSSLEDERWGLFPFIWARNAREEEYLFIPPLFWRWRNPELKRTLTIIAPFYHHENEKDRFFGLFPLFHLSEGNGSHSLTIPPLLFHIEDSPHLLRLLSPLFFYERSKGKETIVSWFYQRHQGVTLFEGVIPFFANFYDPRDASRITMVTPLFWNWSSPAEENFVLLPLFLSLREHGRTSLWLTPLFGHHTNLEKGDETTWIFPSIQISRWHDGDAFNIHPIFYFESVSTHRFTVINPIWWDFEHFDENKRYTVLFPLYYRVVEGVTESQVTLPIPTYYRRREWKNEGQWEWEFHLAGLFDVGEKSQGEHWWRLLYGLIGWEHRRAHNRLWLFYLPIDFPHPVQSTGIAKTP